MIKRTVEKGYEVLSLTGRRPIKIKSEDWPIVAGGESHVGDASCYISMRQHRKFTNSFIVGGSYTTKFSSGKFVAACFLLESGSEYMDEVLEDVERALMRRAGVKLSFVIPDACVKALDNMPPVEIG